MLTRPRSIESSFTRPRSQWTESSNSLRVILHTLSHLNDKEFSTSYIESGTTHIS